MILLDGGSSHSFIDSAVAEGLEIKLYIIGLS